ncbi:MAG: bifunctional phosphopantothenoylcysteine decarboxylase/phosphopantothenate--cysteine ligase CoaBC [Ignavibacteriae bacterium]|nr:MAG: bifunctional phosphopantothenoylcysteine decarboxylase/phosphopantothenate--cysteine ligase CoaBC [Ignavibacteriota bacterium]
MNVLLGITGSVSAYKTPWLVRDLRKAGHDVRVIMTPSARQFVAPLALEATSLHPVIIDPYDPKIQEGGSWHVHLGQWADVMLIAPCSATTLSRLANGLCDTALMTVALSLPSGTPIIVAPAMDTDMWEHATTQRNVEQIIADGAIVIPPDEGELASGLVGKGRLPELEQLVASVVHRPSSDDHRPTSNVQRPTSDGRRPATITITAGPTHEPIDAVRSIVNHSTGLMGFALAEAARDRGMLVTLIAGPVDLPTPFGVERINVRTAADMFSAVQQHAEDDVVIMAAAVADFTPVAPATGKIKKDSVGDEMQITLGRTQDILSWLGSQKRAGQTIVGFALEHENVIEYAEKKLRTKNANMIVANQAGVSRSGFGGSDNTITIISRDGTPAPYPPMSKRACAEVILDHILDLRKENA